MLYCYIVVSYYFIFLEFCEWNRIICIRNWKVIFNITINDCATVSILYFQRRVSILTWTSGNYSVCYLAANCLYNEQCRITLNVNSILREREREKKSSNLIVIYLVRWLISRRRNNRSLISNFHWSTHNEISSGLLDEYNVAEICFLL